MQRCTSPLGEFKNDRFSLFAFLGDFFSFGPYYDRPFSDYVVSRFLKEIPVFEALTKTEMFVPWALAVLLDPLQASNCLHQVPRSQ